MESLELRDYAKIVKIAAQVRRFDLRMRAELRFQLVLILEHVDEVLPLLWLLQRASQRRQIGE